MFISISISFLRWLREIHLLRGSEKTPHDKLGFEAPVIKRVSSKSSFQKQAGSIRVLIIEDNFVNRIIIETILKKRGYKVTGVSSGIEALFILSRKTYDILFMDVEMPGLDGFETARRIRRNDNILDPSVPIIGITAYTHLGRKGRCLRAGMNDFIPKPLQSNDLIEKIVKWVPVKKKEMNPSESVIETQRREERQSTAVFDREALYDHLEGDMEIARKVLDAFLIETHSQLTHLHQAFRERDFLLLEYLAHTLKGASSAIGAERMRQVAESLESAALSRDLQQVESLLDLLQERWREFQSIARNGKENES